MMPKPNSLNEIWPEKALCQRLDLPVTKSGRSLQLNNWVRAGLRYVQKSGRRYFFEQDVIDYLWRVAEEPCRNLSGTCLGKGGCPCSREDTRRLSYPLHGPGLSGDPERGMSS